MADRTRLLSDNGPGYVSRAFRDYLRMVGVKHILSTPFHPQTNGKLERYHQTLKRNRVAHCGDTTEGFYLNTLTGVDIATGWVECRAVWGKGQDLLEMMSTRCRTSCLLSTLRLSLPVDHYLDLTIYADRGEPVDNTEMTRTGRLNVSWP